MMLPEIEAIRKDEEERIFQASVLAEEAGDSAASEAIAEEIPCIPYVELERNVPKVAGVSTRENWTCEVVDLSALIVYVAEDPIHRRHLLLANTSMLNGEARCYKAEFAIPGCKVVCTTSRPVRG